MDADDRENERIFNEILAEAWGEFRYPRAATDEPTVSFKRGLAAAIGRIAVTIGEFQSAAQEDSEAGLADPGFRRSRAEMAAAHRIDAVWLHGVANRLRQGGA